MKPGDIIILPDKNQYIIVRIDGDYIQLRRATYNDIAMFTSSAWPQEEAVAKE